MTLKAVMAACGAALCLAFSTLGAVADPLDGQQTYEMLFKDGTLDGIDRAQVLVYDRTVQNQLAPDAAARDTGSVALFFESQDHGELARLEFRQDGKHRGLGRFPASVGNPMIMFFYESAIRDMASSAGGSAFYIRNRVKEALVQPSEAVEGEAEVDGRMVPTLTLRLRPFVDDPNRDQMQGFGDLELEVVMSEEVPGWYVSLTAEAGETYRSELRFANLEEGAK